MPQPHPQGAFLGRRFAPHVARISGHPGRNARHVPSLPSRYLASKRNLSPLDAERGATPHLAKHARFDHISSGAGGRDRH